MSEERDWLTIAEAASRLGVTRRAVNKYIQQGKLSAYRSAVGGKTLIRVTDLQAFIQPQPREPRQRAT